MYIPLTEPGNDYSPCGVWGCGFHGFCDINNTCTCRDGWSGASCHIPPLGAIDSRLGDATCGNWGVNGKLTLNMPGYVPYCECFGGMTGTHCEVECRADSDCGTGSCDTHIGRCRCDTRCYSDSDCDLGKCITTGLGIGKCDGGWSGLRCAHALADSCNSDADCSGGGTCVDQRCVCDANRWGLRCEDTRATEGMPCNMTSDCAVDTCVAGRCSSSGVACENDTECAITCDSGVCRRRADPAVLSSDSIEKKITDVLTQLLTVEGVAQFAAEEGLEELIDKVRSLLVTSTSKIGRHLITQTVQQIALRRAREVPNVVAVKAGLKQSVGVAVKQSARNIFTKMSAKLGSKTLRTGFGILYFAIQVLGVVLDIDDAAGFNTQVPQGSVDVYMRKMLALFNNIPEVRELGIRFPREYLPQYTFEWQLAAGNEVMQERQLDLTLQYLDALVINSNGERIQAPWKAAPTTSSTSIDRNPALWSLAGKNDTVYVGLKRWWWLILVLAAVVVLTIGLGCGLMVRRRRVK